MTGTVPRASLGVVGQESALLLRIREAATLLAVSERQVWALIRAGELPAIHPVGMRAIRIARDDVEGLIAKWRANTAGRRS